MFPPERTSTISATMLPMPIATIPTMMPAAAVARATASMFLEPAMNPWAIVRTHWAVAAATDEPRRTARITAIASAKPISVMTAWKAASFGLWRATISSQSRTASGIR